MSVVAPKQEPHAVTGSRSEQLQQVIDLSQQMLEMAQGGKWEAVAELEVRRKQLVAVCFQHPTNTQNAPEVAVSIREILSLNQQISDLVRGGREQLTGEIHSRNVGRAATAAYLNHAR